MNINIYQIRFEGFFARLVPVAFSLIKLTALIAIEQKKKKKHVLLNNVLFGLLLLENIIFNLIFVLNI